MTARATWLWTAMVTPFTADNHIDFETFGALLKKQEKAGNGVLILGSTGEALSLSDTEKKEIVRFVFSLDLQTPIMIGTPNINIDQTLDWLNFCNSFDAQAYLAATPLYTKPGAKGQVNWFNKILDAASAPVMLYNVPSRTGANLHQAVVQTLQDHPQFWGLKESSGTLDAYTDYAKASPELAIYCGDDHLLASAAPLGACGLISVAANVWPEACQAYVAACRAGTYHDQVWWHASKALFTTTSPVPVKALMHRLELIESKSVRLPLSADDLSCIDELNTAHHMIERWFGKMRQNQSEAA